MKYWLLRAIPVCFLVLLAFSQTTMGQTDTNIGVVAGPFGVPRLVLDEGGNWVEPIKVYSDSNREIFIADITSPAWAQWHVEEFKQKGTYMVCLYIYNRQTDATSKEFVYMNTRSNSAVIQQPLLVPITVDLAKAPESFQAAMKTTTALVKDQISRYRGISIQDYIQQQNEVVAQMAHEIEEPNAPYSPPLNSTPSPSASSGVVMPKPLNTVEAEYTDEARRAKLQGICLIRLTVDAEGNPQDQRIIRGLGMGLNDRALEAVGKYKFQPAIDIVTGSPIPVQITVEVNFRLY